MKLPKISILAHDEIDKKIVKDGKHWFYPSPYAIIAGKTYRIQDVMWALYRVGKPHKTPKHSLCGAPSCIRPSHLIQ
jgi:hypothetical protein